MDPFTISAIAIASTQVLEGIFSASGERAQARAQKHALEQEAMFNLAVLRQQKIDQYWNDEMSMWRSGLSTDMGTSARDVIDENQRVLQSNIDFQTMQYMTQIKNLKAQGKRKFAGVF